MKALSEQHRACSAPQRFVRTLFPTTSVTAARCENPRCYVQFPVKEAAMEKGMTRSLPNYYGPRDCFVARIIVRCSGFDCICCLVQWRMTGNSVMRQCLRGQKKSDASWDLYHFQYWLKGWKTLMFPRLDTLFLSHTHSGFWLHSILCC